MKNICAFLLALASLSGYGQSMWFNRYDVEAVLNEKTGKLAEEMVSLVGSGKLKAYKDSLFQRVYSQKEWEKIDFFSDTFRTQTPYPFDPSILIDTVVVAESDVPVYRFIRLGNSYIHYYHDHARSFFVNPAELASVDMEAKAFISFYKDIIGDSISGTLIESKSAGLLKHYAVRLHELVMDNKIRAYKNDSLASFYQPGQELFEVTGSTATDQYHDNDYTYVYDSITVSPFVADSIKVFFADFSVVQATPFIYTSECVSISPQKMQDYVDGRCIFTRPVHMYYASIRELKLHLSANELYLLEKMTTYLLGEGNRLKK